MTTIEQRGDLWSTMPGWGIVANLLPPEVVSSRRVRAIRKRMMFVLIAVLVLAAAGYGYAFWQARSAESSLTAEQSRTTQLAVQQHRYAAVTEIHTNVSNVNSQLSKLMVGDVDVPALVEHIAGELPPGTALNEVTVTLGSGTQQNGSSSSLSLDTSGRSHIGTVSLLGTATHLADVATFVDALNGVTGLVDVTPISNAAASDKGTASKFTVQLNLTAEVLTHEFDSSKAGK